MTSVLHVIDSLREASESKNVKKKWKKSNRGGRGQKKNQKVQNLKFGLFDKRGGPYFHFFPQIQMHTVDTSVEEKIS